MTQDTKEALIEFSRVVANAIAAPSHGKEPDWFLVTMAHEDLDDALQQEPETPAGPRQLRRQTRLQMQRELEERERKQSVKGEASPPPQ